MDINFRNDGSNKCEELNRGDRVIVIRRDLSDYGWVRWIGRKNPHDPSSELLAAVELDNPSGLDNHIINGKYLFETLPNHAILISTSNIVHAEDYLHEALSQNFNKSNSYKKNKVEIPLGSDVSHLSTFHKMAFEQLKSAADNAPPIISSKKSDANQLSNVYQSDAGNYDILPHMSYPAHKDFKADEKVNFTPSSSKRDSSIRGNSSNNSHLVNSPPLSPQGNASLSIPSSGTVCEDRENREINDSPTFDSWHLVSHASLKGIEQLEIVSDDETEKSTSHIKDSKDLVVGSVVEIMSSASFNHRDSKPLFGVIRWIGTLPGDKKEDRMIAGVEMEELDDGLCNGTFKGQRYFSCPISKGIFVPLQMCSKDRRFLETVSYNPRASIAFGNLDCQPVMGSVPPPVKLEDVRSMFGSNKGIQGHQNSCYLDATLFSMFAFTSVFDSLLFRPPLPSDIEDYVEVQTVLREEIVNPLRKNMYVRADRIMKLRKMLDNLSSVSGLTTEEKDPEEFLHSLLAQILKADPLLQLSSGQETYHYQLFVDKDDRLSLPSVQTLFDQSFLASDIKLKQVPSCLIIQMPRFGKDYKMYPRILPSMVLDVTDVIEDSPRQCIICGKLAEFECKECFSHCGSGLESISFCAKCMDKVHCHKKRGSHKSMKKLTVPSEFRMLADHCGSIPRVYMELFAVVCIETSHYVSFTRCGSGADATWCFFDSMADRKGEQHGYNIPNVVECGDVMQWIGEEGTHNLNSLTDNRSLPDLPRRLLCDAYMCFYQSPKVMMYR